VTLLMVTRVVMCGLRCRRPDDRGNAPSVERMNFALAFVVAGLAFSAPRVLVTSPGGLTAMWMLFVCRTPPRSDLFDAPERSRLIVVSLFPKACRKAN
jgi:hypothetical protein